MNQVKLGEKRPFNYLNPYKNLAELSKTQSLKQETTEQFAEEVSQANQRYKESDKQARKEEVDPLQLTNQQQTEEASTQDPMSGRCVDVNGLQD